jgi:hypothetical protein
MNADEGKVLVTLVIWISLAIAIGVSVLSMEGDVAMGVAAILGIAGTATTHNIWKYGAGAETGKAKREVHEDTRLKLLIELLDDEDRQRLKHRLMNELQADGELVSVEELLGNHREK